MNALVNTIPELADSAIQILEKRGWCQTMLSDEAGQVCIEGAINVAAYGVPHPVGEGILDRKLHFGDLFTPAIRLVSQVAMACVEDRQSVVILWAWNDDAGRTPQEVRQLLERVRDTAGSETYDLIGPMEIKS